MSSMLHSAIGKESESLPSLVVYIEQRFRAINLAILRFKAFRFQAIGKGIPAC